MTAPLSRAQILELPPTIDLPTLGRALGLSEPVIRERARLGELEPLGIKVVRLGAKYRVVTASLWAFLGLDAGTGCGGSEKPAVVRSNADGTVCINKRRERQHRKERRPQANLIPLVERKSR